MLVTTDLGAATRKFASSIGRSSAHMAVRLWQDCQACQVVMQAPRTVSESGGLKIQPRISALQQNSECGWHVGRRVITTVL